MLYTCAYFSEPGMTIEQAQVAKMDHVARKVWLQPGETVIEAGCGWGALALHLARRYGVTVRAFNTSHEQIVYARARARAEGLHDRVEFVEDDWRNIRGCCDAFVSVGMLEHVRPANYRRLGDVIHGCLKPNGRGLIHSIGRNKPQPMDPWIERRIFPGAIPPSMSQMMTIFERHDFSLLDAENLRLHYALTLRHWLARFEQSRGQVLQMFDERFVRMWRQYLAGSLSAFRSRRLAVVSSCFRPGGEPSRSFDAAISIRRRNRRRRRVGFRRSRSCRKLRVPSRVKSAMPAKMATANKMATQSKTAATASTATTVKTARRRGTRHGTLRRPDRRRRARGFVLREEASSRRASMYWCSTRKRFPATKPVPAGLRRR